MGDGASDLSVRARPFVAGHVDVQAFTRELDELHAWLRASMGPEDLAHLQRLERIGRLAGVIGWATAWLAPNPLSIAGLSLSRFVRWTAVAHPVCHRGYDRVPGTPPHRHGHGFARAWRRLIDWLDWLDPEAWREEHNVQHHFRLNEDADPDLVERNLAWLRRSSLPRSLRLAVVPLMAISWKFVYYAPSTLEALSFAQARRRGEVVEDIGETLRARWSGRGLWSFLPRVSTQLWLRSWAPYLTVNFVLLPLAFGPLGAWAVLSVLINSVLAELATNVHAFVTIVPNHAGDDLYRFEGRTRSRGEFYLRQILGSANYRTGGDANDLMHGWLNYQIEHHLWPDLSLAAYQRAQPRVREVCERHGVPYVQDSVWRRCRKAVAIIVGDASLRRFPAGEARESQIG